MCEQVSYYAQLYNSLLHNKQNSLMQKKQLGDWISNVEGYNYEMSVELWYAQIINIIEKKMPEFYVKSLVVYEDDLGLVNSISYVYFDDSTPVRDIINASIVIHIGDIQSN